MANRGRVVTGKKQEAKDEEELSASEWYLLVRMIIMDTTGLRTEGPLGNNE